MATHPSDQLESEVLTIWRDVLQIPALRSEDNLFEQGSRSITMLRVYLELKETLNVEVPLTTMFKLPSVRDFVDYIRGERQRRAKSEDGGHEDRANRGSARAD